MNTMDNQRSCPNQPISMFSVETTVTGNSHKRRKSVSLLSSLKFWRKKDKKNTRSLPPISRPTEFQHLSGTSTRLVGATIEERYQKAISLPQDITRHSALGSHAPFDSVVLEKQVESDVEPVLPRKILQRRATMPKMPSGNYEGLTMEQKQSILDNENTVDPADIGFAVTSGANFLKRRSRSADAMYAAGLQQPQPSPPIPYNHSRRRSDDIRYWRASVCPLPMQHNREIVSVEDQPQGNPASAEADIQEEPMVSEEQPDPPIETEIEPETSDRKVPSTYQREHHGTFDFGDFAATIHRQENIPLEDRVMTVEVKLMDLEYAISKLQSSSIHHALSTPDSPPQSHHTAGGESIATSQRSHMNSDATTSHSVSTQPTAASSEDSPSVAKLLQTTTEPTSAQTLTTVPASATQEHIATLLSLIRREQASRHRLEDQIVQLQREVKALRQHLMPSVSATGTPSFSAQRGWSRSQNHSHNYQGGGQLQSPRMRGGMFVDDTDTDADTDDEMDGNVVNGNNRREFEGGLFAGMGYEEGVAF